MVTKHINVPHHYMYSSVLTHQMCINLLLKVVPNKRFITTTVMTRVLYYHLYRFMSSVGTSGLSAQCHRQAEEVVRQTNTLH